MSFNEKKLHLSLDTIGGGSFRFWFYESGTDAEAAFTAAGYFAGAARKGMKAGDIVFVQNETDNSGGPFIGQVTAVDAYGDATVAAVDTYDADNATLRIPTVAALSAMEVPSGIAIVVVRGYSVIGDAPALPLVRATGSDPVFATSADGQDWRLVNGAVDLRSAGLGDGTTNGIAAFRAVAEASRVRSGISAVLPPGLYRADGDIDYEPDMQPPRAERLSYLTGHNNVSLAVKEVLPYVKFNPTQTDVVIQDGITPTLYNHVPWLAKGLRATGASYDRLWCTWNGHPSSDLEATDGKLCYLKWSDDNGSTWLPASPAAAWSSSTYCNNPITPGDIFHQPCIIGVGDEVWAFMSNSATNGSWNTDGLIWGRLDAVNGKWTNYRFRENTSTGAISWSSTDIDGAADSGFRLTHALEGEQLMPNAQCVTLLSNGRICLLTTGVEGIYAAGTMRNLVFTCAKDGTDWQFEGAIPVGDYWEDGQWELSLTESVDGRYVLRMRKITASAAINPGERIQVSFSHDLKSWSYPRNAEMDFTQIRPFAEKLSARRWIATSPIGTTRERLSLGLSGDGETFVFGHPVSNEELGDGYPAYSHILRGDGFIYVVYSIGTVTGASDPKDIRLARIAIRTSEAELYAMRSDRGAVQFNDADYASYFNGNTLVLPPRSAGALETRGARFMVTLKWRVTVAPADTQRYFIASIGNVLTRAQLTLTRRGSLNVLAVNGQTIDKTIVDPTQWQFTQVLVDATEDWVEIGPVHVPIANDIRFYLGDAYSQSTADQAGNVEFDLTAMTCQVLERRTQAVWAAPRQTGPNLALNSGFAINDASFFALMPDGWYRDIAGATMTTERVTFTQQEANDHYGGWPYGYKHQTTVLGSNFSRFWTQWDDAGFMAGKVISVAYDVHDASGLSYDLFLDWVQDFGSGGSTAVETPIFHLPIGPVPRRHHHQLRVPYISPSATVGTLPTARLRWRVPSHEQLCYPIISRVDIYEGAFRRDWMTPDPAADLPLCRRQFQRYRALGALGPFLGGGLTTSATVAYFPVQHGPMRRAPDLQITANADFEVLGTGGTFAVTNMALVAGTDTSLLIVTCGGGGMTSGSPAYLRATTDSAELRLSAR